MTEHSEIVKWADDAMFEAAPMQRDARGLVTPRVFLLSATPDPLGAMAAFVHMYAGRPTYDLSSITDEERRAVWHETVNSKGAKTAWEAIDLHFFIEGVTRAFTHQIVRQRTAVFAQESLRFAVKEGMAQEVPLPPSLAASHPDEPVVVIWQQIIKNIEKAYKQLINAGIPAEDARGLLPHATSTRLNYKTNYRGLIEHAGNRLCTQAQFEWRYVFAGIMKAIRNYGCHVFKTDTGDGLDRDWQFEILARPIAETFTPVCYKAGRCVFMGELDRPCSIRERVNEGKFDEINPAEWMLDPTAAR